MSSKLLSPHISSDLIGIATDRGSREKNEDSADSLVAADGSAALLVVADGMGGHAGGEVASSLAVRVIKAIFEQDGFSGAGGKLKEATLIAHAFLIDRAEKKPELKGMGTTVAAAVVEPGKLTTCHVGDSRILQFRGGYVRRLTADHLYAVEALGVQENKAKHHRMGHVLGQVVGGDEAPEPTVGEFDLEHGDVLVLMSDGINESLMEDAIHRIVTMSTPRLASKSLVETALSKGSKDNCTALVVRVA
jgi:protein phosphatase